MQVSIADFLTPEEMNRAIRIVDSEEISAAREIRDKIIIPNIERINKKLGQENDPLYLAYCIEYAITKTRTGGN